MALTTELTAVVVKGSDAGEGCSLGIAEGTEFGHQRDEGGRGEDPDALKRLGQFQLDRERGGKPVRRR